MHRTTPHWTLNSQKCSVYTKYLPKKPKFQSVSLYDQQFSRYKVAENRKCTEWPQTDLKHLTVKSTLHTLNTYPMRPKCWCFSLYDYPFPRYKVDQNRKQTEWPQTELKHLTVKVTLYTIEWSPPGAHIVVRFALRPAICEIQGRRKSEMHRMTPNWTWTLNSQKYPVYTKYLPPEAQILLRFALRPADSKMSHIL